MKFRNLFLKESWLWSRSSRVLQVSNSWLSGAGGQCGERVGVETQVSRICQFPWWKAPTWSISSYHMTSLKAELGEMPHGL